MLVSNTNGPVYRRGSDTAFDFECSLITFGDYTYVKILTSNLDKDSTGSVEQIFESIDSGIKYIDLFIKKFEPHDIKILEFDDEYGEDEQNLIIEKWRNE